jgi:thymidylate synthase (FAD)
MKILIILGKNFKNFKGENMQLIERKELFNTKNYINTGEPGFLEFWDFSEANTSHEARVAAVSKVASVCYGNEGLKPNFKLFDKLARESIGLPSSSFEFVPVLLNTEIQYHIISEIWHENNITDIPNIIRYGQFIKNDE